MANKLVAVLVMCIVVAAALHLPAAEADPAPYRACLKTCVQECRNSGQGRTTCEVKCSTDCNAKEVLGKVDG